MPSYLDSGFDKFMNKIIQSSDEASSLDLDALIDSLSASKISQGVMKSNDGRYSTDLDDASTIVSDGVVDRVRFGQLEDGGYGLEIKDQEGNILVKIAGDVNILQSSDKKLQLDLTDKQLRSYDDLNLRVIVGDIKKPSTPTV